MNLSVTERIALLNVLPSEGDRASLRILESLRMSLSLTEEEFKEWGIVVNPETGHLDGKENGEVDIPIGERATDIIVSTLKRLEKEKHLKREIASAYDKFIPDS